MMTRLRRSRPTIAWLARIGLVPILALACSKSTEPMPSQLVGTWVTDAPEYAGRSLTIRSDSIVFGTSELSGDRHSLIGVETLEPVEGWATYRVSFRELDAETAFVDVGFRMGTTPELRLRHRSEIWRPEGTLPEDAGSAAPSGSGRAGGSGSWGDTSRTRRWDNG